MSAAIRILPAQADDLAVVCAIGADALNRVSAALSSAEPTIRRDRLRKVIMNVLPPQEAAVLCRVIFGLSAIESRNADATGDTIAGLTATLNTSFDGDERFRNWAEISASILTILRSESVYLAAKAIGVVYDFERILTDCRIITSVRPVYNDGRDHMVGSVIVQTLRLDFVDGSGNANTISVAIDLSDIESITEVCRQAKQKALLAREKIEEGWKQEVVMAGEEKP